MSWEGLIKPEGKTGCIFKMSDAVQAHARYFVHNIINDNHFFPSKSLAISRFQCPLMICCLLNIVSCQRLYQPEMNQLHK